MKMFLEIICIFFVISILIDKCYHFTALKQMISSNLIIYNQSGMNRYPQNNAYLQIVNERQHIKNQLDTLQTQTNIYIQSKYQEAIFSSDNFISPDLLEKQEKLLAAIQKQEEKQSDILIEIQQLENKKKYIQNTIETIKISKEKTKPIIEDENNIKSIKELKEATEILAKESAGNKIDIKSQGLTSAIQRKKQLDRQTASRLQKLIKQQQIKIAMWNSKIEEYHEKIEFDKKKKQQMEKNLMEISENTSRKLMEDHRSNLDLSISRLSQYIRNNSQILPFIE